jgi:hypothetical protein
MPHSPNPTVERASRVAACLLAAALVAPALVPGAHAQEAPPVAQESQRAPALDRGRAAESRASRVGSAAVERIDQARVPLRYVRARTGGVTIRNLADVHGLPIVDAPEGALLAVHGETAGWLEVDVPGGLPVWVFGRYLREVEGTPGVLEVTNNNVNMRPRAGSDVNNFPLGTRLVAGDQVAEITREDPTKPLEETWVQIWAPPAACGWVQAERTVPLVDGEIGPELWLAAETALASGEVPTGRGTAARTEPREAAAPTPASLRIEEAQAAIALADELFAVERERAAPDFEALRDAYRRALEPDTGGAFTALVDQKLATVDTLEEIVRTRALLEEERVARRREHERRQREQWDRLRERDPFYGRFAVRGVLESFQDSQGRRTYRVVRGGEAQAVVTCTSGRYDLELFVGRELGLDGGFVVVAEHDPALGASPFGEASAFVAGLPSIDIASIDVLQ